MGSFIRLFVLALSVTLLINSSAVAGHDYDPYNDKPELKNHGGPMLTGTVNLAIMWYGYCGKEIKNTIRNFIKSLDFAGGKPKHQPKVVSWWEVVESYQSLMPEAKPGAAANISVKVAKQSSEKTYKLGMVLTLQYHIPKLIKHVTKGDPNIIPVIVAARDVTIQGVCHGKCADHLLTEPPNRRPFIIVGNPEVECPGECGWPFHAAEFGLKGPVLKPPNGNMSADAMVVSFASALADMVTSPMQDGFYHSFYRDNLGPSAVCKGIFGRGAAPGNPGQVQSDPKTGGNFNAYGYNNKRFLLPAVWNPKTKSCWIG
ncbi:EXORDIUM like 6 [Hibiscus trionum]|uniref:EXORDIUM like 6 n=1 Tax=Hibiscus trionum TaxID=183268 RepID=A0A9W7GUP2_HIBTR|nr:EXORDIUM like 6 [Hibiscus trionum]